MEPSEVITKKNPLVVTVGTYKNPKEIVGEVQGAGYGVSEMARIVIGNAAATLVDKKQEVELAFLTLEDLKFDHWPATEEIVDRATNSLGFEKIPPEAMAKLRLALPNQSSGERCIGMHEPLKGNDSERLLSVSNHCGKLWLTVPLQLQPFWKVKEDVPPLKFVFAR